jgi:hypothetical protein
MNTRSDESDGCRLMWDGHSLSAEGIGASLLLIKPPPAVG